ncbi:pyridoxal phosphate-dependent aminotransferase [Phenylobacterium sp.]|uniref:pyridoxal phosphate-dependent aminotransferase n=1 Tax=Phenylobacterium sp. TaxID=1871053 RepID=UPI0025E7D1C4|nr:pyridoxal phosphate-dependent aminotransferase [Phenylobacterium sp.]MBX3484887.1 pyridoxal phosphate-dependent aminotransferase [Phenylobacterium sp.]MCW5761353.1 pyridoxal phosphate-dependent aminotransferase [Phenylobacterium sp.]
MQSKGAASAQPGAASPDLFDAPSYADFVRAAMRIKAARPEVAILFESTTPEPTGQLIEVVRTAFSDELTSRYVSVFADGNRYAIEAVARRYGLAPEQIVATTGATGAITLALKAFVTPGDEVLVERPGFDILGKLAVDAGARVAAFTRIAPDYRVDLDAFRARLTPRTRAVLITNLHNPSGARLPPEDLAALAAAIGRVGAVLIVDEVYADFVTPTPAPAATLAANILTVSSLTKVFGLFALKFGWMAGDAALIDRIRRSAPDGDMGVSKLSHAVAAHVLEAPEAFEAHWQDVLGRSRPVMEREAAALVGAGLLEGDAPSFGCMYFPRVPGWPDTRALARRLLADFDVLVAPGEFFGAPGRIRLGFGIDPDALASGLTRLRAGLSR